MWVDVDETIETTNDKFLVKVFRSIHISSYAKPVAIQDCRIKDIVPQNIRMIQYIKII